MKQLLDRYMKLVKCAIHNPPYDFNSLRLVLKRNNFNTLGTLSPRDLRGSLVGEYLALYEFFDQTLAIIEAGKSKKDILKKIYVEPRLCKNSTGEHAESPFLPSEQTIIMCNDLEGLDILKSKILNVPLNCSHKHIKKLLDEILNIATTMHIKGKNTVQDAGKSRFIVVGEIGTGKSQFLNYVYSVYNEYINEACLWIRVDLTKDYLNNLSIEYALKYQLCRIARDKYEHITKDVKFQEMLLSKRMIGSQNDDNVINVVEDFLAPFIPKRPTCYDEKIMDIVDDYFTTIYPTIFVIDGFDNIHGKDEFEKKMKELKEYIIATEKNASTFIISMRNTSYARYIKHSCKECGTGSDHGRHPKKVFRLIPVDLKDLLSARLSYITADWRTILEKNIYDIAQIHDVGKPFERSEVEKKVQKAYDKISMEVDWISEENLNIFLDLCMIFAYKGFTLKDLVDIIDGWNNNKAYHYICAYSGSNTRKQINCFLAIIEKFLLSLQYNGINTSIFISKSIDFFNNLEDILKDKTVDSLRVIENLLEQYSFMKSVMSKHYLVINSLLSDTVSYSHPVEYDMHDGKMQRKDRHDFNGNSFVYSLYHGVNVVSKKEQSYHLLAKIRILQYLKIHNSIVENYDDLAEIVSDLFSYDLHQLKLDIEELCLMRYVCENNDGELFCDTTHTISITSSGIVMIERLIFDYNYLRTIVGDVFVPSKCGDNFCSFPGLVNINTNIHLQILKSIPYVLNFCSLVSYIDKLEVDDNAKIINKKFWKLRDIMCKSISDSIARIVNAKASAGLQKELNDIYDFIIQESKIKVQ